MQSKYTLCVCVCLCEHTDASRAFLQPQNQITVTHWCLLTTRVITTSWCKLSPENSKTVCRFCWMKISKVRMQACFLSRYKGGNRLQRVEQHKHNSSKEILLEDKEPMQHLGIITPVSASTDSNFCCFLGFFSDYGSLLQMGSWKFCSRKLFFFELILEVFADDLWLKVNTNECGGCEQIELQSLQIFVLVKKKWEQRLRGFLSDVLPVYLFKTYVWSPPNCSPWGLQTCLLILGYTLSRWSRMIFSFININLPWQKGSFKIGSFIKN